MYKFIYKRQCSYVFIDGVIDGENAMPVWKLMTSVEKLQKSKKIFIMMWENASNDLSSLQSLFKVFCRFD